MQVIEELRRRYEAATPGRWKGERNRVVTEPVTVPGLAIEVVARAVDAPDAAHVSAMHNAHEALLRVAAAVARYAELDELRCDYRLDGSPDDCPGIVEAGGPCHWCEMRAALTALEQVQL